MLLLLLLHATSLALPRMLAYETEEDWRRQREGAMMMMTNLARSCDHHVDVERILDNVTDLLHPRSSVLPGTLAQDHNRSAPYARNTFSFLFPISQCSASLPTRKHITARADAIPDFAKQKTQRALGGLAQETEQSKLTETP